MSRTVLWIIAAALAAILLIGGTVWLLRSRDAGGFPSLTSMTQGTKSTDKADQALYDPPSKYAPAGGKIEPTPAMPVAPSQGQDAMVQMITLPSTLSE